ncbi:MAG: hypothetical protein KKI08_20130 [Armatimonadetes bacterium]|nr:hypothetical protein [Armatimonadota bacterium]
MSRAHSWVRAHRGAAAVAVMAAVVAAVFARTLFLGQVLCRDDLGLAFVPWLAFLSRERLAGNWLPWCLDIGCGFPLWANLQSGAFYPPNLLGLAPLPLVWTFGALVAGHYLWAAVGMYLLGRRLALGHVAAAAAGLTFALTGFVQAHQVHYSLVCAAAWMPWFALGLSAWARRRRP